MQKADISSITIIQGYIPGAIGRITELHATYYSKYWSLDLNFEAEVATELSEFLLRFDPTYDGIWLAVLGEEIVGAIAIDGSKEQGQIARLRWFIIASKFWGCGLGQLLMQEATAPIQPSAASYLEIRVKDI